MITASIDKPNVSLYLTLGFLIVGVRGVNKEGGVEKFSELGRGVGVNKKGVKKYFKKCRILLEICMKMEGFG